MNGKARVWKQEIIIPTYPVGKPDKNPMFLDKRVYQGSSGKVYPHTVIDKIYDEKKDVSYQAVFLENDFIQVMVLPELGGRIQRAYDKTTGCDFVYYNQVIKPALVGLAGPWISGGIEFNWPQHHRPSTFDPVEFTYSEAEDGSATVVVGELENMFRTKGFTRITLYPDSTYIELKTTVFNATDVPQTFLWWANPAVAANEHTRSVFPPDVTAVMDHGKRDVSSFPIARGTYYKMDYSKGVDISRYKNIPVPTSYMAAKSEYDFVGGYDEEKQTGILHVADHHVAPGKKQWTWGCGDFGKAWDRNLTDEDGPYIELMTGCYTDNQPDFTFIAPMEEKTFTQYFMPYQKLGTVHNATKDLAMKVENGTVELYATGNTGTMLVSVYLQKETICQTEVTMKATDYKSISFAKDGHLDKTVRVEIKRNGVLLLSFAQTEEEVALPEPAKCPPLPKDCKSLEDLYLYGLHIEQYRHATYRAEDYYLEGLRRDSTDIRLNNAYGLMLLRRGLYEESETYFRRAIAKATRSNPNPYDSEPYYHLGLSLFYQERDMEAYDTFYKAIWRDSQKEAAYFYMACIMCKAGDYQKALEHIEEALIKNAHNFHALNLKCRILNKLHREVEAKKLAEEILRLDPINEQAGIFLGQELQLNPNTTIELAIQAAKAGCYKEAVELLQQQKSEYPLTFYYLAYYCQKDGQTAQAHRYLKLAETKSPEGCFPHRPEDIAVLKYAIEASQTTMAYYYLGNLLYDKQRRDEAIDCFEQCTRQFPNFPTAYRNLALAYFNDKNNREKALSNMEKAFELDKADARVLFELDNLYKKLNYSKEKRLAFLEQYASVVTLRDDLYLEYITLLNLNGRYEEACQCIKNRKFHPWEGGEGKVPAQYIFSLCALATKAMQEEKYEKAMKLLKQTFDYPHNLGEGKLYGAQENLQNYLMGLAYEGMKDKNKAVACFELASRGLSEPAGAVYYNDQPPETIFCQGMALQKLGRKQEAAERYDKLISFADIHCEDNVKIDYFAVSLPDFLVFDADLNLQNKVHCLFMKALGLYGREQWEESKECLCEAENKDNSHSGIGLYKKILNFEGRK